MDNKIYSRQKETCDSQEGNRHLQSVQFVRLKNTFLDPALREVLLLRCILRRLLEGVISPPASPRNAFFVSTLSSADAVNPL